MAHRAIKGIIGLALSAIALSLNGEAQATNDLSRVVEANTRFSFKLFHHLAGLTPEKNLLVTPTGLSLIFALLDNGADPRTREEIESAFEFKGLGLEEINGGAKALREALQLAKPIGGDAKKPVGFTAEQWRALQISPPNGTIIADSLWLNHMVFPPSFLKVNRDYYDADVKRLAASPSPSVQLSQWAMERTRRRISISAGPLDKNDFLFIDLTYFHEFWKEHFPRSATRPGTFTLANGSTKQLPFMYQAQFFQYFENEKFQAVILPYSNTAMFIFLPREDSSLKELEQSLTAEQWMSWRSQFDDRMGTVGMPRFQMEASFDLGAALKELGVNRAFDTFAAFSPIAPTVGARLKDAIQKTQLKVDENGTEAVSIGMIGGVAGGVAGGVIGGPPPPPPFKMIMNRPFFFAIVHRPTGQLLFLGAVMDP